MSDGLLGIEALGMRPGLFLFSCLRINEEKPMTRSAAATVLTVDDDPIVRADLRLVLEDAGFDVLRAMPATGSRRSSSPALTVRT